MFANKLFLNINQLSHESICDNLHKIIIHSINYNIQNKHQSNDLLINNLCEASKLLIIHKHNNYNTPYYLSLIENVTIQNVDFVNLILKLAITYQNVYLPIILFTNITYFLPTMIEPEIIYRNMRFLINKITIYKQKLLKSNVKHNIILNSAFKHYDFAYLQNRKYNLYLSKIIYYFHNFINPVTIQNNCVNNNYITKNKIKICFISKFLAIPHSVFKDRSGIIKNLNPALYDIYIVTSNEYNHLQTNSYWTKLKYIHYHTISFSHNNQNAIIQLLQSFKLNVLFFCEIGMCQTQYKIAFHRIAPIQINTFGHSDTSGLPNIDYFISSKFFEPSNSENFYSEKLIKLNSLGIYYQNPLELHNLHFNSLFTKKQILRYLEIDYHNSTNLNDIILFVCMTTFMKINITFLKTLQTLLVTQLKKQPTKKSFIIFNLYGITLTKTKLTKIIHLIQEIFKPNLNQIIILNNFTKKYNVIQTQKFYYSILQNASCILEPFPFGGLNSTYDALSVNQAVISFPSNFLSGRFTLGLYKKINFTKTLVNSIDNYIEVAYQYANNIFNLQTNCKQYLQIQKHSLLKDYDSVQEYNKIIKLLYYKII